MVFFEDLNIGDTFRCVDSGDLNFMKTSNNVQHGVESYKDNATCITTRVNCYIPRQCVVILLEKANENKTN